MRRILGWVGVSAMTVLLVLAAMGRAEDDKAKKVPLDKISRALDK